MKGWVWAGLCAVLAGSGPASAAGAEAAWRIEGGEVKILVPLRPGGAFTAATTSLRGTLGLAGERPARLSGEVRVDLSTIDTGIALRNQHLKEKYLEVAKGAGYDAAVVSDIVFRDAPGEAFEGSTPFTAQLLLHGVKRRLEGTAEVRHLGANRRVKAVFPVVMSDFGITAPEYLGVGVGNRLMVTAQFTAVRTAPAAR
jgi:polyisoprenoid-binding protein YceI